VRLATHRSLRSRSIREYLSNRNAVNRTHQFLLDAIQTRDRRLGFHVLDDELTVAAVCEIRFVVTDVDGINVEAKARVNLQISDDARAGFDFQFAVSPRFQQTVERDAIYLGSDVV